MVGPTERLSEDALSLLGDPTNELLLSAASAWEIAIKSSIGKLDVGGDPLDVVPEWMIRSGVTPLEVLHSHALQVASLPHHHADPFDRILISQAVLEQVPVLTADAAFAEYDVEIIAV